MLLRHSASYALARGVPALVNFCALALYTRLLNPEEYGRYALALAGVTLANGVLLHWLRLGTLRYLPGYAGSRSEFLSTLGGGYLLVIALSLLPAALGLVLIPPPLLPLWTLGTLVFWVWALFDLTLELRVAGLYPREFGLLLVGKALFSLTLGASLVLFAGLGALGPLLGVLAAMLLMLTVKARLDWRDVRPRLFDPRLLRRLAAYGLPLTATFALSFVVEMSDRFLIGWLVDASASGLYAASYDLPSHVLTVIFMIINLAAYPLAVRALEEAGPEAAVQQLRRNLILLLGLGLPSTVGLALLSPGIATLLLGAEFRPTALAVMPWVAVAALLANLKTVYFDLAFQLGQHTLGQVWVLGTAAIINLVLNLLLIPTLGAVGAALATLVAYVAGLGLSAWFGRRWFPLPFPVGDVGKLLLATGVMALCIWPFRDAMNIPSLLATVLVGTLSYGAVVVALDLGDSRRYLQRLRPRRAK